MAITLSKELTRRGAPDCRPNPETGAGTERSFAGGIGAKKVDVSCATDEIGLIFGVSIKGIYFPDATQSRESGKLYFAKNLMNRKGDMLAESTTLHKRFPYAVLGGLFFFDKRAAKDAGLGKRSTYERAHRSFRVFSDRLSHSDADEKYELFALGLCDSDSYEISWAGKSQTPISLDDYVGTLLRRVADVNVDHFEWDGKNLIQL